MRTRAFHVWMWGPFLMGILALHLQPLLPFASATAFKVRNETGGAVWVSFISPHDASILRRQPLHHYGVELADIEVPQGQSIELRVDLEDQPGLPYLAVRDGSWAVRKLALGPDRAVTIRDLDALAPVPAWRPVLEAYSDPSPIWMVLAYVVLVLVCLFSGVVLSKPGPPVDWN